MNLFSLRSLFLLLAAPVELAEATPAPTVLPVAEAAAVPAVSPVDWSLIIAVAALHRPVSADDAEATSYEPRFKNKIRTILRIALVHGQTHLVLGAFGCGGQNNIPNTIAGFFHSVLAEEEFAGAFEHIVFAMLPVEGPDRTYDAFLARFPKEVEGEFDDRQILLDEYTEPIRIYDRLTGDNIKEMIRLLDNKQFNEDSARNLGIHLKEALILFAEWLRTQCNYRIFNLDYLILEQYDGDEKKLDEEDQEQLDEITNMFYDEVLARPQDGTTANQLIGYFIDEEYDLLYIAIGYIYAVQKMKLDQKSQSLQ